MTKEAMERALEALEHPGNIYHVDCPRNTAITALREALADQQTDWEAVAADQALTIGLLKAELQEFANKEADALEVALTESGWMWDGDQWQRPAQRKPLTDEEIDALWLQHDFIRAPDRKRQAFARAVEAAHGIKENT